METSLNGMIARDNNEEDFIPDSGFYNWLTTIRTSGYVMWGRKTHDIVLTWESAWQKELQGLQITVITADPSYKVDSRFHKASSPQVAIDLFRQMGAEHVFLSGGSGLNSSFAQLGLIDEIIVTIEPVVIGKGISLFSSTLFDLNLQIGDIKKLENGAVQLHYAVIQ